MALQIGHRLSVDFDFFCEKKLPPNLLTKVKRVFREASLVVTYRSPEQLNLLLNNVKVTFFQFEYPVIQLLIKYKTIPMAGILEIAAMKAFAIGKRLSYKDYVDWYFLLKEGHVDLKHVIGHAKKKFGGDFNDRLFLGQLSSLEDVPTQKIEFLRDKVNRETIHDYLTKVVRSYKI